MSKKNTDRKIAKLKDQIERLEEELRVTLHKKEVGSAIDVAAYIIKIRNFKNELAALQK